MKNFDAPKRLRTYRAERYLSIGANYNAILGVILDNEDYPIKGLVIANFVCNT